MTVKTYAEEHVYNIYMPHQTASRKESLRKLKKPFHVDTVVFAVLVVLTATAISGSIILGYNYQKTAQPLPQQKRPQISASPTDRLLPTTPVSPTDVPVTQAVRAPVDCQPGYIRMCRDGVCECLEDTEQNRELQCVVGGGTWTTLRNGCVDMCVNPGEMTNCTEALTQGCYCGGGRCWDGTSCVPGEGASGLTGPAE